MSQPTDLRDAVARVLRVYGERGPRDSRLGECVFCGSMAAGWHAAGCEYQALWDVMHDATNAGGSL